MFAQLFLVFFLSANLEFSQSCLSKLFDETPERKNVTEIRQQLLSDVDQRSDSHKRSGHGYAEVRTLLHKFNRMVATKNGKQADMYDENRVNRDLSAVNDGIGLSQRRAIAADLFEGDIVLTLEQIQHMIDRLEQSSGRRKRKVIADFHNNLRWPNEIVPYSFTEFDGDWQDVIRSAIAHWESETCIRFKESANDPHYIQFYKGQEHDCHSSIGRIGGAQALSIGYGCEIMGIVAHEIGHALGFFHEQSRPDRDNFINVRYDNIDSFSVGNFEKRDDRDINDYGVPYDLGSIMHYSPMGFALNPNMATIETRDPKYQDTIGQREHLSFIDIKQANMAYCADRCPRRLGCQNGGYEDPNDCDKCKCPEGLAGTLCDSLPRSSCGEELTANAEWQELSNSDRGDCCYWRITGAAGGNIRFAVKRANFPCSRDEGTACTSYVEIKHKANYDQAGFRVCCEGSIGETLSETDNILVFSTGSGDFTIVYRSEGGDSYIRRPAPSPVTTSPSHHRRTNTPSIMETTPMIESTPVELFTAIPWARPEVTPTEESNTTPERPTPSPIDIDGGRVVITEEGGILVDSKAAGYVHVGNRGETVMGGGGNVQIQID